MTTSGLEKLERVAIVNKEDQVLTYKPRIEVSPDDWLRYSAVWVENSAGLVLISKRASTKAESAQLWGPACTGTVRAGETAQQNAVRELHEELGVDHAELTELTKISRDGGPGDRRVLSVFTAIIDLPLDAFSLQPEEVTAVRWTNKACLAHEADYLPELFVPNMGHWMRMLHLVE